MEENMKRALIIKKVHLDKIFAGEKTWEMRSSKTKIRGKIGLIESGTGLIVGEAYLAYVLSLTHKAIVAAKDNHRVDDTEQLKKWRHAWVLLRAKRYENPINYNHPQGAVIWVKL